MKYSCKRVTRKIPEPFSLDDAEYVFPDGRKLRGRGANIVAAKIELESGKSRFLCRKNGEFFLFSEPAAAVADDGDVGIITPLNANEARELYNGLPLKKPADEAFPRSPASGKTYHKE